MYGVVLSRRDFREADQVISILTAEEGKREYIARGVKKITSKNTSNLEPGTLVSFGIAEGKKEWAYLTNVQPVESYIHWRQELAGLHIVGYALDAVEHLVKEAEADATLYHFVISFLRFIDSTTHRRLLLLDAFLLKLLAHLGYHPELDACVVCEKSYTEIGKELLAPTLPGEAQRSPGFYFAGGGLICFLCSEDKKRIGERFHPCGIKEISTMRFLLSAIWKDVASFQIDEEEYRHVHTLIYEFLLYHSEWQWGDWGKFLV